MLGKTHRSTGMAVYLSVLTQELVHNEPIVKQNVILSTLYTTFVAPITHALGLTYVNPNDLYKFLFFALVYGFALWYALVLPDVDSKNSILGRHVPFIEDTVGHRTIFHSLVPIVLLVGLSVITSGLPRNIATVVTAGYLFHLIEDAWSVSGINWFVIPMRHKFKAMRYEVGGLFETVVYYLSIALNVVMVAVMLYQIFKLKMPA